MNVVLEKQACAYNSYIYFKTLVEILYLDLHLITVLNFHQVRAPTKVKQQTQTLKKMQTRLQNIYLKKLIGVNLPSFMPLPLNKNTFKGCPIYT
jgi:hypothetical protein